MVAVVVVVVVVVVVIAIVVAIVVAVDVVGLSGRQHCFSLVAFLCGIYTAGLSGRRTKANRPGRRNCFSLVLFVFNVASTARACPSDGGRGGPWAGNGNCQCRDNNGGKP